MNTECDVSVIIVNYKTSHLIADCLRSIFQHTVGIEFEIIVIDNNSEPEFAEIIKNKTPESDCEKVIFLSLPENIGFGRANNKALELAKGRNLFFLNPDTVLLNNAIKILSDFLDSNSQAGACGGNLLNENLIPTISYKRKLPGIHWELDELLNNIPNKILYGKNRLFNHTDTPLEVAYITGADLMARKEVIEKTGAFSEDFFMFYEETDLCARIKKAGWKIFSVPEARIQHLEGKSFSTPQTVRKDKIKFLEESRLSYLRRNNSNLSVRTSNFIYSIFLRSRILLLKKGNKKESYREHLRVFQKLKA